MSFSNKKKFFYFIILVYSFYDRSLWSDVSQWQVDEATTMWIGLTESINNVSVGLISSHGIPNPNGMIYLSKVLSLFPSLWSASYALSILQLFLISLLGFVLVKDNDKFFFIIITPLIFCLCLRSISAHMSNQWILTLINLLYFILVVIYLNKPSITKLTLLSLPILLAPSIYLSGIANSIAFLFCTFFIILIYPPKITLKKVYKSLLISSALITIFFYASWFPYLKIILTNNIEFFNQGNSLTRLNSVIQTIIYFPYWSIVHGAGDISGTFKHNGLDTVSFPFWSIFHFNEEQRQMYQTYYDGPLSNMSVHLLRITSILLIIQAIISTIILFFLSIYFLVKKIFLKNFFKISDKKIVIFLITIYLFIFFVLIIGAFLGSPNWIKGLRLDTQVHLLPFLLIVWFLTPWIFKISDTFDKYFRNFSSIILLSYILLNIFTGQLVYNDHMKYKGKILTDADVPLVQKQKAIDFIVEDWKKNSKEKKIKIGYYFTDKRWSWVDKFGEKLSIYYPNIYTRGREFDYHLLRSHGLYNNQEGTQHRSKLENEYIISYNLLKLPINNNQITNTKTIGRLKVTKLKQ